MKTSNTNLIFLIFPLTASGLTGLSASGRAQGRVALPTAPAAPRSAAPAGVVDSVTGIVHSRLLRSGVPLGGVGAGTFQLRTDGTVGQASVGGDPARRGAAAPGCFLALWTRAQSRAQARVLALQSGYGLPAVSRLDYDGLYPQANLAFPDASPYVQASLLAFSPLVPFDLRNSSFPAAAFILRLKNTTTAPVEVSGLLSWESLLPADANARHGRAAMIFPSVQGFFGAHLGNAGSPAMPGTPDPSARASSVSGSSVSGSSIANPSLPAQPAPTQPQMTVAAYPQQPQAIVTAALWDATDARPGWWDAFARDGDVPDGRPSQAAQFARPAACVSVRLTLKPGEAVELPFAVAWYMPRPPALPVSKSGPDSADTGGASHNDHARPNDNAGHYYQVAFDSADDAAMQLLEDWRSLYGLTEEWQKRLLFSNLPRWMARRLINSAAPLSTHAVHTLDGRFAFLDTVGSDATNGEPATRASNAPLPPAPSAAISPSDAANALQSERDATFAHQSADALLLALFPQLAAQELRQFAAMQDASGFVAPPAGADWAALLGPPLTPGGPLIPNASGLFALPDFGRPASGAFQSAKPNATPAAATLRGRGKAATPAAQSASKPTIPDAAPVLPPSAPAALDPTASTSAYVLQTTRFLAWTGDADDVERFYPSARRAVDALLRQNEATLAPLAPASLTLRLAALKAGQRLARRAGDEPFANQCENGVRQGRADMEARLWNGEFYQTTPRIIFSLPSHPAKGSKTTPLVPAPDAICASDQLWGQWLAYQLDLGPLLPPDHLLRAAQSIQRRNDLTSDTPPTTPPLSLLPAQGVPLPAWHVRADGKPLPATDILCLLPASILADAALNIWQDQPEVGVALLRRLEEGRDSVVRSPWQYPARVGEEERGRRGEEEKRKRASGEQEQRDDFGQGEAQTNFAASSLAAAADWNLLYALQGFALDMNTGQMTLAPNIPGLWRTFNAPIFAPTFWGQVEYRPTAHGGITSFRLDRLIGFVTAPSAVLRRNRAELTLKTLRVLSPPRLVNNTVPTKFAAYVSVGQKPIGCRATQDAEGYITLAFDSPLALTAGDRLEVDVH